MSFQPTIQFLKNTEIDRQKWDDCITNSLNRLIYARTFYLDTMAKGWTALVGENYDWVFPITAKRKYGITYLAQPALSQQLGLFARPNVIVPFNEIIEWLKEHYRFWEIHFNYATVTALLLPPVTFKTATNFILNLSGSYDSIAANYHKDLVKNLRRSKRLQLRYEESDDYDKAIELFRMFYADRLVNIKDDDYESFGNLCSYALRNNMLIGREAVNSSNELLSMVLIFAEGNRLYNLMNVTTEAGRRAGANHFLLDAVIKEFSDKDLTFDFEGSDVPGIKSFYENFGAINQPFYLVKYNHLPWLLRLLKE